MTTLPTSDVTRILHAIWRRWWIVGVAALLGGVLGLVWSNATKPVSYQSIVLTTPIQSQDAIAATRSTLAQLSLNDLAATVMSAETKARLGADVANSSVSVSPAEDKGSLTVRASAVTDADAKRATIAYATEAARLYSERTGQLLQRAIDSVDAGIAAIKVQQAGEVDPAAAEAGTAKLADLTVTQKMLQSLADEQPPVPTVTAVATSNSRGTAILTLAVLLGGLGAAMVGLLGLYDRTLRFQDDVESVVGPAGLLGHVRQPADVQAVRSMLERVRASGRPVVVTPVGPFRVSDALADFGVDLGEVGTAGKSSAGAQAPSQVLVAALGKDTRAQLDLAHRLATTADGPFLGVLAVDPKSGALIPT